MPAYTRKVIKNLYFAHEMRTENSKKDTYAHETHRQYKTIKNNKNIKKQG